MIALLSKFFIKNGEKVNDPKVRQAYGMLCGLVGIILNVVLFAGKFLAGLFSNSIAITADAFNNLSDAGSSAVTLVGFHLAGSKPDPDHPFGHGRIEYLSGLIVSAAILIMAFELIRDSVMKIITPQETQFSYLTIVILAASILVKVYMFCYNRNIGRKIDSAAMRATAIDSLSDTAATTVVLLSTLVSYFMGWKIDGYCGVLVGMFVFYAGISAAKETLNPLLGQPPDEAFVERITEIVMAHENILGVHDLIVHDYGPGRQMISLHAEVPAEGQILEIHDLIDVIELELHGKLGCQAVIHMDPIVTSDERVIRLKQAMVDIAADVGAELSIHDFRMVPGNTHTNLIFDVVVPYDYRLEDAQVIAEIRQRATEKLGEKYFTVIQIDKAYEKSKK